MRKFALVVIGMLVLIPNAYAELPLLGKFNSVQKRFDNVYNVMSSKMVAACGTDEKCRQDLQRFMDFIWENKDKRNVRTLLAKCTVKTAISRGYVTRPFKVFTGLNPQSAREVAQQMCSCTVGSWAAQQCAMLR